MLSHSLREQRTTLDFYYALFLIVIISDHRAHLSVFVIIIALDLGPL